MGSIKIKIGEDEMIKGKDYNIEILDLKKKGTLTLKFIPTNEKGRIALALVKGSFLDGYDIKADVRLEVDYD